MDFEQALIFCIIIGAVIGISWGLRRLVLLEKKLLSIETHVERIVEAIEKDEKKVLKKLKA